MVMTKSESAAKAREARAAKQEAEKAAPTAPAAPNSASPTSYVYVGGLNAVLVVIDGTSYEFRLNDPVHLPHAVANLDVHPDFERVPA